MIKIYDLRDDKRTIKLIQNATLNTKDFGLKPEHGLFGSGEWWEAIENGTIPKKVLEGIISRVYMSGHNDFPEFEVTASDRSKTNWGRRGHDKYYVPGKKIKMIYVVQKFKRPLRNQTDSHNILEIWIEGNPGGNRGRTKTEDRINRVEVHDREG